MLRTQNKSKHLRGNLNPVGAKKIGAYKKVGAAKKLKNYLQLKNKQVIIILERKEKL